MACLRDATICLIISFILFGLPFVIYDQVVKPREPTFTVEKAAVTGLNLTATSHLTAVFDITIRAHNPNHKMKLKYRGIRVSVFKDKQNLCTDALPGFTQRKGNVTVLSAQPVALNLGLKKAPAFDFGVETGFGYLDFDVFMTADLNGDNLEVNCKHVMVNISAPVVANTTQKFQTIFCSVLVFQKNNDE